MYLRSYYNNGVVIMSKAKAKGGTGRGTGKKVGLVGKLAQKKQKPNLMSVKVLKSLLIQRQPAKMK